MFRICRDACLVALFTAAGVLCGADRASAAFQVDVGGVAATWSGVLSPNWNENNSGSQTGNYYWSGNSWDSTQPANVGNFLTKTGYFSANVNSPAIAKANLEFVKGAGTGGRPTGAIAFGSSSGTTTEFTKILLEVAGLANQNELWYKDSQGETKLFDGTDGTNTSTTFTAHGQFYLILKRTGFSRSTFNSSQSKNFSVFRDKTGSQDVVFVGIEDLNLSDSDKDYNDMVIRLENRGPPNPPNPIPAPPSLVLAVTGMLGIGLGWRRMRRV